MSKNLKKKTRLVSWRPEFNTVYPRGASMTGVSLDDLAEPDRITTLLVHDDDALYLARDLAAQLGYKLVQI